jgi:hypothetical protein
LIAMKLSRALPLLLALAAVLPSLAAAQFGGMPGTPGAPAMPPFGADPAGPPPACQQLLSLREETRKHAQALQAAGQKKASPEELCKLFKVYLEAERKMVTDLEEHQATCGLPADLPKQVKASHAKASQMAEQICEVAAQGPRPRTPFLFDAPVPQCTEKTLMRGVPCVD